MVLLVCSYFTNATYVLQNIYSVYPLSAYKNPGADLTQVMLANCCRVAYFSLQCVSHDVLRFCCGVRGSMQMAWRWIR